MESYIHIYIQRTSGSRIPRYHLARHAKEPCRLSTLAAARHSSRPSQYAHWAVRIAGKERQGYFDLFAPKFGPQSAVMLSQLEHVSEWRVIPPTALYDC